MSRLSERECVAALKRRLEPHLRRFDTADLTVSLGCEVWLAYARELMGYGEPAQNPENNQYRLDMVVFDVGAGGRTRIPRVAVEFKLGTVTANDAIAYNEKARTYRLIYPYLRPWLLVIDWGRSALPARLVRAVPDLAHVGVIEGLQPSDDELAQLVAGMGEDIGASRKMQCFLLENRKHDKVVHRFCRRKLVFG